MNAPHRRGELDRLGDLQRQAAEQELSDSARRALRDGFMVRVEHELREKRTSRSQALYWSIPVLAGALTLAVWLFSARSLTFQVLGAVRDGDYVRASSDGNAQLHFSDNTRILVAAGSRVRIEETSAAGARILLEQGRVEAHVTHRPGSAWTFVSGPFEVLVTGTRFALDWDPQKETFDLALNEGSVEIHGPSWSGSVALLSGQYFHGDVKRHAIAVSEGSNEAVAPSTRASASAGVPAPVPPPLANQAQTPEGGAPGGAASGTSPSPNNQDAAASAEGSAAAPRSEKPKGSAWREQITRGKFTSIVREAEQRGIPSCLASCTAEELRALADAALYTQKAELAYQTLQALRRRFAGRLRSDATFSLGRLDERRGALAAADRWYESYMYDAPSGAFAAEALAGRMRVLYKLGGKQVATPVAREYLRRFPNGVQVSVAREILAVN